MTPTPLDLQAAVQATDREIETVTDRTTREMVSTAVLMERRAVLGMLADYEAAVAGAYDITGSVPGMRRPMLTAAQRIEAAVEITNAALSRLDSRGGPAMAVAHERTVVALLCGSYPQELIRQWNRSRVAELSAVMVRDGKVELTVFEPPLIEAMRKFGEDDNEPQGTPCPHECCGHALQTPYQQHGHNGAPGCPQCEGGTP